MGVGGKTRKGRGMTEERRRVAGGSEARTKKRRRKEDTKEEKWNEETARDQGSQRRCAVNVGGTKRSAIKDDERERERERGRRKLEDGKGRNEKRSKKK